MVQKLSQYNGLFLNEPFNDQKNLYITFEYYLTIGENGHFNGIEPVRKNGGWFWFNSIQSMGYKEFLSKHIKKQKTFSITD